MAFEYPDQSECWNPFAMDATEFATELLFVLFS